MHIYIESVYKTENILKSKVRYNFTFNLFALRSPLFSAIEFTTPKENLVRLIGRFTDAFAN